MPHPKNRLKLTGDTHLPDVSDYMHQDDDAGAMQAQAEPRVYADGWTPPAESLVLPEPEPRGALQKAERKVAQLPARSPWLAIGVGLMFGWLVARMLRH